MNERTTGKSFKVFNKIPKLHKKFRQRIFKQKNTSIVKDINEKELGMSVKEKIYNFFIGKPPELVIEHTQIKTRVPRCNMKKKKARKVASKSFMYNCTHHRGHART